MPGDRGPVSAFALGWAGVLPFAAFAAAAIFGVALPVQPLSVLIGYGAVILSFMAGAQWGLTMMSGGPPTTTSRERGWWGYAISVSPALLAWCCLFAPTRVALAALAVGFALLLAYDIWSVRRGYAPPWYSRLRWQLTATVVVLLVAPLLAGP